MSEQADTLARLAEIEAAWEQVRGARYRPPLEHAATFKVVVNAVPWLLAAVRRLQEENAALRELQQYAQHDPYCSGSLLPQRCTCRLAEVLARLQEPASLRIA